MTKEINFFLTYYHISDKGLIWSIKSRRYLKLDKSTGYASVVLSNNRKKKRFLVHRLAALLYLRNHDNKPCVNHKDGDKLNNDVRNLEWCTYSENEKHSFNVLGKKRRHSDETKRKIGKANKNNVISDKHKEAISKAHRGKIARNVRPVILEGKTTFSSITVASIKTGISVSTIHHNINGRTIKTKVGKWKYAEEEN